MLLPMIHPTAVVHPGAKIHSTATVGPYSVIGEHVTIGAGTEVMAHVVIEGWTEIGSHNRISPGAVIGGEPQDLKYRGAPSKVIIGDHNRIRECVTVNRATHEDEATVIGSHNLFMAYVHIAHNCCLGDHIVIANAVALAGHVTIESRAVLGGMSGFHQFVHVGKLSMVGAMSRVERDVPPFMMVQGQPVRVRGINSVGLERAGIADDTEGYLLIRKAYRLLYRSDQPLAEALDALSQFPANAEVDHLRNFLAVSISDRRRGPIPPSIKGQPEAEDEPAPSSKRL